jgi:hypothetical protein
MRGYLNTDLDLESRRPVAPLVEALTRRGMIALGGGRRGRKHFDSLETSTEHSAPEQSVVAILKILERLKPDERLLWDRCETKRMNIGFDGVRGFQLSAKTLPRMTALHLGIAITEYRA